MEDEEKQKEKTKSADVPPPIREERVLLKQGECILLHGFLSPAECMELIKRTETAGYKENDRLERTSNCSRVSFYDSTLADKLWRRVEPFVTNTYGKWKKKGLNDYWRFCKYEDGQYFGAHVDGVFVRGKHECSKLTLMIYLSEDFVGGTTRFFNLVPRSIPTKSTKNDKSKSNRRERIQDIPEAQDQINYLEDNQARLRVKEVKIVDTRVGARAVAYELVPRIGLAVLFDQEGLLHDGLAVFKGVKYIMRTDVQFERLSEEKEKEKETEQETKKKKERKGAGLYKKKK